MQLRGVLLRSAIVFTFFPVLSLYCFFFVFLRGESIAERLMKDRRNSLIVLKSTLGRLPSYYCEIENRIARGEEFVSSTSIAESLGISPVQVRKDLASISSEPGRPKRGFNIDKLLKDLKIFLGYDRYDEAVLVGVGALGHVLLHYGGFSKYGLDIVAGFDIDPKERKVGEKHVLHIDKMVPFLKRTHINIGIIAVPTSEAQGVADLLVAAGVQAIWNFAPTTLKLPDNILVKNENLAASLAALSSELHRRQ